MELKQQDVITLLVQNWAKSHHELGGDFGSFISLIGEALRDAHGERVRDVSVTDPLIKLQNYLGVLALQAVPEWATEPLDSQMTEDLERLLED